MMKGTFAARVLLSLGLLAGGIAYSGWTAQRTAFDPSTTGALAHELIDSEPVQDALTDEVRDQVRTETQRTDLDPEINFAIEAAMADPRFVDAFAAAVTQIHRQLLDGNDGEVVLDTARVTNAVADALESIDPTLAEQLRAQQIVVDLGDADLPDLGRARDAARTVTLLAIALALVLLSGGVAAHPEPRAAVRRIGRRVALLAVGPVLLFVALPWVLRIAENDSAIVAGTALDVYRGRVLPSAIVLAVGGVMVWAVARFLPKPDGGHDGSVRTHQTVRAGAAPATPQPPMPTGNPRATERLYL